MDFHWTFVEKEALRDSEERYRFLFESSPAAVYSIDARGVIQDFNRCAAELWGRAPLVGDTDERFCGSHKMFRPDGTFMPHDECPMAQVVAGVVSEVHNAEVIIERPDASRITVIVNIRALTGPNGAIVGAINCFYDITERVRTEQLLQQQALALADMNRRKDEFLAMLSHELRNPLAPILNSVRILENLAGESPDQKRVLAIVERQVAQLTRLVNDLTDAARIGRGAVSLRLEDVDLDEVVERAADSVRHLFDERSQKFSIALPPEPIRVRADAARLEQIIVNLLVNAAKYTDRDGRILLSVEQQRGECTLRVRDTGIGISAELLPHVFELFTQAAPAADRAKSGLGIGLALVHQLVGLHQGRVEAHSVLGEGSEFVVTLPAAPPRRSRRSSLRAEEHAAPSSAQ